LLAAGVQSLSHDPIGSNALKFSAELIQTGKNTTGIAVPAEPVAKLGKRGPLRVTLNGYTFVTTPGTMHGQTMISLSAERRAAAAVVGGQTYEIEVTSDPAPASIEVPAEFAAALADADLASAFAALAPSHRKEHVRAINEAKSEDTRSRRIAAAVRMIKGQQRGR
jgi:hypothetical protein